jgi:uncharacterized membrane protein
VGLSDWLLALHLLAAFALVAALVVFTIVIVAGARSSRPSEVVALFTVSRVGDVLVAVGSIGTLVFGIWLALDKPPYHFYDPWILVAIALWAVAIEAGRRSGVAYTAVRDRARALLEGGNDEPSSELADLLRASPGRMLHLATSALVVLILLDMVFKPGA